MNKNLIIAGLMSCALLAPITNFATAKASHSTSKVAQVTGMVNINTADANTLMTLKDIGKKKAEAIVAYRTKNGDFKAVSELTNVKGISQRIINDNKGHLTT